jgi:small-conductance mechanosensitive channel
MHICHAALISTLSFAPLLLDGQANSPTQAPSTPAAAQAQPAAPPSTMLQPALATVESTLNSLKIDKWKRGSVRDEAGENVNAILRDLKTNVPPLLTDADAAPAALSKSIPLMKHLDAVYDVLLRVEEGARVSAPGDQVDQLEAALKQFGVARIQLYDSMQQRAAGQEKQVTDLQAEIKTQKEAVADREKKLAAASEAKPCAPPKPAPKKRHPTHKTEQPANGKPAQNPPAQTKPPQ